MASKPPALVATSKFNQASSSSSIKNAPTKSNKTIVANNNNNLNKSSSSYYEAEASSYPTTNSTTTTLDDNGGGGGCASSMVLPVLHAILVVVLTGLLASDNHHHDDNKGRGQGVVVVDGWMISPTRCTLWVDGMCISTSGENPLPTAQALAGELMEYESQWYGLLSSIHPPFLCLAVSVLSLGFMLKSSHMADPTSQMMKHMSLVLLAVYAALYLFMRDLWGVPINNVLLVECIYVLALFFVGTYSAGNDFKVVVDEMDRVTQVERVCLVNVIFTYPLLAVAALAGSGMDTSVGHLAVFFSLTIAGLVILAGTLEVEGRKSSYVVYKILLITFWLCLVPFVVQCATRLDHMKDIPVPVWATAALGLVLGLYLLSAVIMTLQLQYLGGISDFSPYLLITSTCCPDMLMSLQMHIFQWLDFVTKASVTLLLVISIYNT